MERWGVRQSGVCDGAEEGHREKKQHCMNYELTVYLVRLFRSLE